MADFTDELDVARQRLDEAAQYLRIDEIRDRRIELEDQAAHPDCGTTPNGPQASIAS